MSKPYDPNEDYHYDDDFNIEDFTSQVDFGDEYDKLYGDGYDVDSTASNTDPVSDTGAYEPVRGETEMAERRRRTDNRKRKKKKGKSRNVHTLSKGVVIGIYALVILVFSFILAKAGWAWANDLLALNKESVTATVELSEDMFTEKQRTTEAGEVESYYQADMGAVARELKDADLIEYPWLFKLFAGFTGKDTRMSPGSYELDTNMDYSALLRSMSPNKNARQTVSVLIPEGYSMKEIFALLAENEVATVDELMDAAANYPFKYSFLDDSTLGTPERLEGYLFPDTYQFYKDSDPATALSKMLVNFDNKFTEDLRDRASVLGYSLHDILTVASIIEKETDGVDQTLISSVVYNRLENTSSGTNGYLQMDSTIQYILDERKEQLTEEDLAIDSPYNTYKNKGLPAGPICSPGMSSIRAALYPEDTNYYYFILGNDETTHFFNSYNEFLAYKNSMTAEG